MPEFAGFRRTEARKLAVTGAHVFGDQKRVAVGQPGIDRGRHTPEDHVVIQ